MHIGLIGGIGPAATEFYYRGLIERHAKAGTAPDLTIVHADVRDMARNLANHAALEQAEIFARLIQRLAAAGAELAAVTSMGGHFCIRELAAISALPLLNAIPEVDAAIRARNLRTIGIIGTRNVMDPGSMVALLLRGSCDLRARRSTRSIAPISRWQARAA
jgi:aspartate racemase